MNDDMDIVQSLPIGTLVFTKSGTKVEIITINERLLEFANLLHILSGAATSPIWDQKALRAVFAKNLFSFPIEEDVAKTEEMVENAKKSGYAQTIFQLRGTSGENAMWILSLCSCRKIDDLTDMYYTLFLDCTKAVRYERALLAKQKELENITRYDVMTRVCNRFSYNVYLENCDNRMDGPVGIVFADLNGIKAANDEFGHLFGDSLLSGFSEILLSYFEQENIFRISGDEFVVILPGIDYETFEEKVKALLQEVNDKQLAAVGYKWEKKTFDLKQSIYATEKLMMIQKQKYYTNTCTIESKHRPKILKKLMENLEQNKFTVFLQPKASLGSAEVVGAEALIRMYGPDGQIIPPYEFVPVLEKEMLISTIDFFVLEEVCKLLKRWKEEGQRQIVISVNMSRVTMAENDFLEHILSICDKYETDHELIELEITESTDTKDNKKMNDAVAALCELGFKVSLDDMGNDYSSIKMITMKGIETVKIDRSLVLKMGEQEGISLLKYIIQLCHEIGKKCIAEGVEDVHQAELLEKMNCDYYQGYLLSRPVPIEEFEKYL